MGLTQKHTNICDDDFRIEWFSGTGKGGQHRNKHQNSCRLIHEPTGITEVRQGRKRETNLREAKAALRSKLHRMNRAELSRLISDMKKNQVGSGMRGDKIRTYRVQDDAVHDHNTDRRANCTKVLKGHFDLLWN